MRARGLPAWLLIVAGCGGEPLRVLPAEVHEVGPEPPPDPLEAPPVSTWCSPDRASTSRVTGEVSGFWNGRIILSGDVRIAAGKRLELCPGTSIDPSGAKIIVDGELAFEGTRDQKITFDDTKWEGIAVEGKLSGGFVSLTAARICIDSGPSSIVELVDSELVDCEKVFWLRNGGRFERVKILRGVSPYQEGGMLTMIDTVIDLGHPGEIPDCIYWLGGGGYVDHVHFTGCHTAIHVNRAPLGFTATNSIFDHASLPIMMAETSGFISGNNIMFGAPQLLDVGGKLALDVSGNYWAGHRPYVSSSNLNQFIGMDDYSETPLEGVGPRNEPD